MMVSTVIQMRSVWILPETSYVLPRSFALFGVVRYGNGPTMLLPSQRSKLSAVGRLGRGQSEDV
jgi:hypothetical protein